MATTKTGAENVRWDLTTFYSSPTDPAIERDLAALLASMADFDKTYRGQLNTRLGAALTTLADLTRRENKLGYYMFLSASRDTGNTALRKTQSRVSEALAAAHAKHFTFFDLEVAKLDEGIFKRLCREDNAVAHHKPMLEHTRALAKHYLSEEVEEALTLRDPFGPSEWDDMMDEIESKLEFAWAGSKKGLPEMLHVLEESHDAKVRAKVLQVVNDGLAAQKLPYFQARALNVMMGDKAVDDTARNYPHAMSARNLGNQVDDATVKALHDAAMGTGAALCQRFYRLKAQLLKQKNLKWSDRQAPLPFSSKSKMSWAEACDVVRGAYTSFSPTLGKLVDTVLDSGWVDAPPASGKVGGAYDATAVLPDGDKSYMLLNFMGTPRDVATLAHELGHAVHGLLAAQAQGPLMWHAPMVYAETASVFGEMLTFEHLLASTRTDKERLVLLVEKLNDFMNTVVRQIGFSLFEQELHAKRRDGKLGVEDIEAVWAATTQKLYGVSGNVFTYENTNNLWSYIGHFHSPFYVYAYAFGELFTQSLMSSRERVGAKFEPLYLDLLRAGGTKDGVALLAPFGLDPTDPAFWENGLLGSAGKWLEEAEKLAAKVK
ncbi:MAG TPA: M3 family oligoendopeptidase [Alphaproteobacteria bacterium]|nr:M3 family oligoendopeptidase [Alphaproteobacteria bacterium]